ncbi:MAG: 16S rRNA (cytosine(1402)-N(4))-methyltransferase RsmH [Anaerolineales bacterium]
MNTPHISVLYKEIIHAMQPKSGGRYVDGTLGAGGHAYGILEASVPDGLLLGLDLDPSALALAAERLRPFGARAFLRQASYADLTRVLREVGWDAIDGMVLDLGVSSMQLDTPERGFSFLHEAPLDMRFGPGVLVSAADLVNTLDESELADIIFRYGEDRNARRIARAIVRGRPFETTTQLAQAVAAAGGVREARIHPATRTFQALRIAVNAELQSVERVLPAAIAALRPGGRLAVIAFHSLEDRIVKEFFRRESTNCLCPPRQPICTCGHKAVLKELTRKPVTPTQAEIEQNPRARSAKLRIAEKL